MTASLESLVLWPQFTGAEWQLRWRGDEKSDRAIGRIRDSMWNDLGRPRHSAYLDQVFPDGVGTYTMGDVHDQPVLMHVLHARLLSASAPAFTPQQRTDWAATVEALRVTLAAALDAHRPADVQAAIADASYRSAVRGALVGLQYFKRDLLNQGLTESQIHEIIPDATPVVRAASGSPKPATAATGTSVGNPPLAANDSATPPSPPVRAAG